MKSVDGSQCQHTWDLYVYLAPPYELHLIAMCQDGNSSEVYFQCQCLLFFNVRQASANNLLDMYCNYFPPRSICAADMKKEELDKVSINMQNGNFYVVEKKQFNRCIFTLTTKVRTNLNKEQPADCKLSRLSITQYCLLLYFQVLFVKHFHVLTFRTDTS